VREPPSIIHKIQQLKLSTSILGFRRIPTHPALRHNLRAYSVSYFNRTELSKATDNVYPE